MLSEKQIVLINILHGAVGSSLLGCAARCRAVQLLNMGTKIREGDSAILDVNGDHKAFVTVKKDGYAPKPEAL